MAENTGAAAPPATDAPKASVFTRDGFPPVGELVPNALQHVLACFAGVITPAMILSVMCGLSQEEQSIVIQMALILSALDTILQQFPLFGKFGSNLPIVTGVSYAFLMPLQAIGVELGFSAVLGCEIVGGIMSMVFGFCYNKVSRIFPPIVTGTVIFAIGVSLYPTAIKYMAGGAGSEIFGSVGAWVVGLATFAIVFVLQTFAKGVFKIGAIFFGTITLNGIRILVKDGLTPRSCTIFGISVAFGLGIYQVTGCLAGFPDWVTTIFATSAITPCAIMAIILNTVLPPEEPDNAVATEMVEAAEEALVREDEGLPEPMEPEVLKKGQKAGAPLPITEKVAKAAAKKRGDDGRPTPGTDNTGACPSA